MADKILWQSGDDLSETNFAEAQALTMTSGYVEGGMGLSADYANDNFDVGSGLAIPRENNTAYLVFADERQGVSLANPSGMNYVYLAADTDADTVSIHVDSDDTPPANLSLKLGEIDAGAESTPVELNRNPSGAFASLTATDSLIDPAGVSHTGELADDGDTQPPETHDNSAHSATYATETYVDDRIGTGRPQELINSPNATMQTTGLGAGEGTQVAVPTFDGETLTVYRWGGYRLSNGFAPQDFVVQLVDGSGNVVTEEQTPDSKDVTGVASYTNNTGSRQIVRLRIKNNTGNDYSSEDIAGHFAYEVE